MNYQKVIEELEHHVRESADFLAGFPDADEMESEKAAYRAMVCAVHALKQLTRQNAAMKQAGMNTNAAFCEWAPPEVRAPYFAAWDAALANTKVSQTNREDVATQPEM